MFSLLKGGEVFVFLVSYAYIFVLQIGEKDFDLCLLACLSPYICIHVYELYCISIYFVLCMS